MKQTDTEELDKAMERGQVAVHTGQVMAWHSMPKTELHKVLSSSLYPDATPEALDLVIGYCKAQGLDLMQKPVHIVSIPVRKKDAKGNWVTTYRDAVWPGVGLYRIKASSTGSYAGKSDPEFGPMIEMKVEREVWEDDGERRVKRKRPFTLLYPEWCRIKVYRIVAGHKVSFVHTEYWLENVVLKGDVPNDMWTKRPRGQLAKCTEAQVLRQAFSEIIGNESTVEEMEGRELIVDDDTVPASRYKEPQQKQQAQAETIEGQFEEVLPGPPVQEPAAPVNPQVSEKERKPLAPKAAPMPDANDDTGMASTGERAHVTKRLGARFDEACEKVGISVRLATIEQLTGASFLKLRAQAKEWGL